MNSPSSAVPGWPMVLRHVSLQRGGRAILDDVSLTLQDSDSPIVILGRNGAGKSQLLRLLNGLVSPDLGEIRWRNSRDPQPLRQDHLLIAAEHTPLRRSIQDCMTLALRLRHHPEPMVRCKAALDYADLLPLAQTPAPQLSSGQQQRLMLGIAWALECRTLLLDEPTAHLDPIASQHIETMIQNLQQTQQQIIVSHDVAQAQRLGSTIVFLDQGRVLAHGTAQTFFADHDHPIIQAFAAKAIPGATR